MHEMRTYDMLRRNQFGGRNEAILVGWDVKIQNDLLPFWLQKLQKSTGNGMLSVRPHN